MGLKYSFGNLKKSMKIYTIKCTDMIWPKNQNDKFVKNVQQE